MPMQRDLYPPYWEHLAYSIKAGKNWQCEECGRPCRRQGESFDQFEVRLAQIDPNGNTWAADLYESVFSEEDGFEADVPRWGRFTLTVAHLDHNPANCHHSNLKALCAPCHCRYDLKAMATKRRLKAERAGQLTLEGVL